MKFFSIKGKEPKGQGCTVWATLVKDEAQPIGKHCGLGFDETIRQRGVASHMKIDEP